MGNYSFIIFLVISLIGIVFYIRSKKVISLIATVYQDNSGNSKVIFEEKHPAVNEAEYIKLCLHFFAKALNICKDEKEFQLIFQYLQDIPHETYETRNLDQSNLETSSIRATLRYVNSTSRIIIFKVPLNYYSGNGFILGAVKAIYQSIHAKMNDENKVILSDSLQRMDEIYSSGVSPKSFKNLEAVPNQAFLDSFI
ncbi:MAG: hypothetical protein NXI00_01445 [Cytophagales bacterium]|nr:hypothetical protein [Cytophagales bacterium]